MSRTIILGAGMTGLAAGLASGASVFEAAETPGGICSSYHMRAGETRRLYAAAGDGRGYRFEIGGGHWIFGGNQALLHFLNRFGPVRHYRRRSSVFFPERDLLVPYPLQNHLRYLDKHVAEKVIEEMSDHRSRHRTMKQWLAANFGPTLCDLFFYPFHRLYTAGLYERIAPQDAYKSPVELKKVIQGASKKTRPVGYNTEFVYPADGLNHLAQQMAAGCDLRFGKRAVKIDARNRQVVFSDGGSVSYDRLISTLPLNQAVAMSGLTVAVRPDPFSSVLVLNIGAVRGKRCPQDHWLYIPRSSSGFHRVGFYSNVDHSFLPASRRNRAGRVSIYVERAFPGGEKPPPEQIDAYSRAAVAELQSWGFIDNAEVVDPTWIEVAYTWSWPGSDWKRLAIEELEKHAIYPAGRYARWTFNGIAASLTEGLLMGSTFKD